MSITNRRKQFLEEIFKIYEDTLAPIHYETIANAIGVSKWTAYDVMKVLEKEGYLERTYQKNLSDTGRSMVVFIPTQKVVKLLSGVKKQISTTEEEREIKERAIDFIETLQNNTQNESVNQMLLKIKEAEFKVEFCCCFLGFLTFYLNKIGNETRSLTKFVHTVSDQAHTQLSVFVGLVVGMIKQREENDGIILNISEIGFQFFEFLDELNSDELNMLVDFLKEM